MSINGGAMGWDESEDELTDGVLAHNVNEVHPRTGEVMSFSKGDPVPRWLVRQANHGGLWEGGVKPEVPPLAGSSGGPPPQGGAGSSKEAWLAYARSRGVYLPDGSERADIITACEAAGVATS